MNKTIVYLSLLFVTLLNGQNKFEKGYYIDLNDQKIECTIKYSEPRHTPTYFEVMETSTGIQKKIGVDDVKLLEIENIGKFISTTSEIDRHNYEINYLESNPIIIKKNEKHFFDCIIDNKFSLLKYEDSDITRYFYSINNYQTIVQLDFKKYTSRDIPDGILYNNEYKNQLLQMNNCKDDSLIKLINNSKYNKSDLTIIFEKLNSCSGLTSNENKFLKKSNGISKFKIALNSNFVEVTDNNYLQFGKKFAPGVGFEYEYALPYYNNMFSLLANIDYFYYNSSTYYSTPYYDRYNNSNVTAKLSALTSNFGVKWNVIRKKKFRFFVFDNFNLAVLVDSFSLDFKEKGTINWDGGIVVRSGNIGFGFGYKKFELNFKLYNNKIKETNSMHTSRSCISLKYNFGKN
jgi:hypothetical protein